MKFFITLASLFMANLTQAADCPSLAGVYSNSNQHLCLVIDGREFRCVDLLVVTQDGCSEYSVFEKQYIINGDRSLGYGYGERPMKFSLLMGAGAKSTRYSGEFPVLTDKLVPVDFGISKTQYVTATDLTVFGYNGFDRAFYQQKMTLKDNNLVIQRRDASGVNDGTDHYYPGSWSNWSLRLELEKIGDTLPDSIWNTYETGFSGKSTSLPIFFENGFWNTRAPREGYFGAIPVRQWKSIDKDSIIRTLQSLDTSKKYTCSFKAHRLDETRDSRRPQQISPVFDSLYVETIDSCSPDQ